MTASAGAARPGGPISAMVSPAIRMSAGGARWPLDVEHAPVADDRHALGCHGHAPLSNGRLVDAGRPREEDALDGDDDLEQHDPHDGQDDQPRPRRAAP